MVAKLGQVTMDIIGCTMWSPHQAAFDNFDVKTCWGTNSFCIQTEDQGEVPAWGIGPLVGKSKSLNTYSTPKNQESRIQIWINFARLHLAGVCQMFDDFA